MKTRKQIFENDSNMRQTTGLYCSFTNYFTIFCLFMLNVHTVLGGLPKKYQCPENISIGWVEMPPYVFYNKNRTGEITGLLVTILEVGLRKHCCSNKINFHYHKAYSDYSELVEKSLNSSHDVVLPIVTAPGKNKFLAFPYVLFIESPGAVLFNYRRQTTSQAITHTFFSSLPLVLILLLYVCVFGVMFWIVDTIPKKQGEKRTLKEIAGELGEGIWWAFVTLATVGYGDVVPTKLASRILCFIWMIISSVSIAFFTASVTSTLISECFSMDLKIPGETIAAINGSREHKMILKKSGIPKLFKNYDEYLKEASLDEEVKGTVIELYAASFFTQHFRTFRIQEVFEDVAGYGVVLRTNLVKVHKCMKQHVLGTQREIYNKIRNDLPPLTTGIKYSAAEESSMDVLSPSMMTLRKTLLVLSGTFILLSILGLFREKIFLNKKSYPVDENLEGFALLHTAKKTFENTMRTTLYGICEDITDMQTNIDNIIKQVNNVDERQENQFRAKFKSN